MSIIIQNLAQLKAIFEKQWESIVGNCDELLYLRTEMNKVHINTYQSYYGKETIDTNSYGKSIGHSGSYSTNYQIAGSELMSPEEIRRMNNDLAIAFIRGEKAVIDLKYNTFKHPNFKLTEDGGYKPYLHDKTENAVATIFINNNVKDIKSKEYKNIGKYEILVDEEIEEYLDNKIS